VKADSRSWLVAVFTLVRRARYHCYKLEKSVTVKIRIIPKLKWTGISQSLDKYFKGHSHLVATQALPLRGTVTLIRIIRSKNMTASSCNIV
jgi:hypothetical protein